MADSNAPKPKLVARLNAYKELLFAGAALIAALGSLLKPTDTSATEAVHAASTSEMAALHSQIEDLHADLANLHGFVNGYIAAQGGVTEDMEEIEEEIEAEVLADLAEAEATRAAPAPKSKHALPAMKSKKPSYQPKSFDHVMQTAQQAMPPPPMAE